MRMTLRRVAALYGYKVRFGYSVVNLAFVGLEQRQQHSTGSRK